VGQGDPPARQGSVATTEAKPRETLSWGSARRSAEVTFALSLLGMLVLGALVTAALPLLLRG
jgi:hypothetical protein